MAKNNQFNIFTKFKRHTNNSQELISATDINKVQNSVNIAEENVINLRSNDFINKALFIFDNNIYPNKIFIDPLETPQYLDLSLSNNYLFDPDGNVQVASSEGIKKSIIYTVNLCSSYDTPPDDFVIITDENIPAGGYIKYYLSVDNISYYPIEVNNITKPNKIEFPILSEYNLYLKIEMGKNIQNESPKISGYSVLWFDKEVERKYGIPIYDFTPPDITAVGETIIVRDPTNNDKVIRVLTPTSVCNLHYNEDGTLNRVTTAKNNDSEFFVNTLVYGDYTNSEGDVVQVLLKIITSKEG